ncbi:MAG: hypothetical protein DMG21_13865 [Acidobacteria bacterium]|nr:MAG: hypothetical protein DMG21_13865 [Acidobacteriota bacterium]
MTDQDYATVSGERVKREDFAYAPAGSKPSEWKLPIHDAAHVRNGLARFGQTDLPAAAKAAVYAKILRAAKQFGVEVPGELSEIRNSKIETRHPNFVFRSSSFGLSEVRNGLVKIAVAYTGEFERDGQRFSISSKDLEEIARNLSQREAPIDYEHLSAQTATPPGWSKAAGWIRRPAEVSSFELRVSNAEKRKSKIANCQILWGWAELTPACLAMVKQKEYRYFSPEISWKEKDEHGEPTGTRLRAGAMTNRPFLKDLPPIEISDGDYNGLFGIKDSGFRTQDSGKPMLAMVALSDGATLMDLDSVHVPAASKNISVAYHQPGRQESGIRIQDSGGQAMAKRFSFRRLTDGPHAGKFGLYKTDELMTDEGEPVVFDDDDFPRREPDNGNGGAAFPDAAQSGGPAEVGEAQLAATEAQVLAEVFREGRVDLGRASALADQGRIGLGGVFRAQAAEKLVDRFIAEGKLLPKRRAAAFRLALEDEAALRALLSDARPMVDFRSWGLAGAGHLAGSAQSELDEMVRQWIAEHNTDYSGALSEVTKRNPELWQRASAEVSERARSDEDEQE